MPYQIGYIPVTVMADEGIVERVGQEGPSAEVRFKVNYAQRYELVRKLLGTVYEAGGTIEREPPFAYPPSPELYCVGVSEIRPLGKITSFPGLWPLYPEAIVTAQFGILPFGIDEDNPTGEAYAPVTLDIAGEFLTFPRTSYRFTDVPKTLTDQPIGRILPTTGISLRRYMMPYIPQDEIDTLTGKINDAPFRIGRRTYATNTLLFHGGNTSETIDTLGAITYEIEYRFEKRPVNWNHYAHPTTGVFTLVTHDGTVGGDPPYEESDFTILPG